jgi:hypothetical protein
MIASKIDSDSLADSLKTADDKSVINREGQAASRRYIDTINSAGRTLNLERRDSRRERRICKVTQYKSPARRIIIDRRDIQSDRRGQLGQD